MKKTLLALICAIAAIACNAQVFVGGTLGVSTEKQTNSPRYTTFSFAPTIGYTISDAFAVGVELNEQFAKSGGSHVNTVDIGPYIRYSFYHSGAFSAFGEAEVYYSYTKVKDFDGVSGLGVLVRPGISYMVTDNWQLLAKMTFFSYSHYKGDNNATGFSINPANISLGVAYNF
ncbi:MAG: porin family protein [Bacteroidales bacterium]|nr:porin family protein [Bacteroidales bacterium]